MAPIKIDGTDITGATIDGQDVQEITVDGDTVFTSGPTIIDNFETSPDGPYPTNSSNITYAWTLSGATSSISRSTTNPFSGSFHVFTTGTSSKRFLEAKSSELTLPNIGDTFEFYYKFTQGSGGGNFEIKAQNDVGIVDQPWSNGVSRSFLSTYRRFKVELKANESEVTIFDSNGNVATNYTNGYSLSSITEFHIEFDTRSSGDTHSIDDLVII